MQAASYYRENNFSKSLEIYLSEIKKDPSNPYLYYNAANCYLKLGNKTQALAYYIKSFILNPRNSDNIYNLKKLSDETLNVLFSDDIPYFFYRVYYFLSEYEIKALIQILFFVFSVLIVLWLLKDKLFKKTMVIVFVFMSLLIIWYTLRKNSIFYSPAVTVKETELLSGPSLKFTSLATVPESKVVFYIKDDTEFAEVGLPQENIKGWVRKTDLIIIKGELHENSNSK